MRCGPCTVGFRSLQLTFGKCVQWKESPVNLDLQNVEFLYIRKRSQRTRGVFATAIPELMSALPKESVHFLREQGQVGV